MSRQRYFWAVLVDPAGREGKILHYWCQTNNDEMHISECGLLKKHNKTLPGLRKLNDGQYCKNCEKKMNIGIKKKKAA